MIFIYHETSFFPSAENKWRFVEKFNHTVSAQNLKRFIKFF